MTSAIVSPQNHAAYLASLPDSAILDFLEACRDDCRFILEERAKQKPISRRAVELNELMGRDSDRTLQDSRTVRLMLERIRDYEVELGRRGVLIPAWPDAVAVREFAKISEDFDAFTLPEFTDADEIRMRAFGIRL
jgi:hypothetical protein